MQKEIDPLTPELKDILDLFKILRDNIIQKKIYSDKALKLVSPFFELLSDIETMKLEKYITPSYLIANMSSDDPGEIEKNPELNYYNILVSYYKYLDNLNVKQHVNNKLRIIEHLSSRFCDDNNNLDELFLKLINELPDKQLLDQGSEPIICQIFYNYQLPSHVLEYLLNTDLNMNKAIKFYINLINQEDEITESDISTIKTIVENGKYKDELESNILNFNHKYISPERTINIKNKLTSILSKVQLNLKLQNNIPSAEDTLKKSKKI